MSSSYLWGLPLSFSSVLLPPVPACSFLQLYWSIFLPSNPLYLLVPLLNLEPSSLSPLRAASPGFTLQVLFSLICHVIFLFSFPDLNSLGIVTLYSNNIIHKTFPTLILRRLFPSGACGISQGGYMHTQAYEHPQLFEVLEPLPTTKSQKILQDRGS